LYVEGKPAARELGLRSRGGFLQSDDDFAAAIADGAFTKVLALRLLRDVTGEQFAEAISSQLAPRARLTGAGAALEQYVSFLSKQSLSEGTRLAHLWTADGERLQVETAGPTGEEDDEVDWETRPPELDIASPSLARGLFEIFLGGSPVVPEARAAWCSGARSLLESDEVTRDTNKSGGTSFW
jgi:hypothetical protein